MKKLLALVALLATISMFAACTPRMAGHVIGGAIIGAAVVGTVAAHHAAHHAHYHHYNCGCPRHWDGGRWVYYYQGGYEYYDPDGGVWYRYY